MSPPEIIILTGLIVAAIGIIKLANMDSEEMEKQFAREEAHRANLKLHTQALIKLHAQALRTEQIQEERA